LYLRIELFSQSPNVDTTAPTFDKSQYTADLDNCRGGSALNVSLDGLVGAVYGSAVGAAQGALNGAVAGDAPEGAVIGADVRQYSEFLKIHPFRAAFSLS